MSDIPLGRAFRNLRLSTFQKLTLCFTGMLFLAAAISALLLFSAVRIRASYQALATLQLDQARLIQELESTLLDQENRTINLVLSGSENRPEAEADYVPDFETVMGRLREAGLEPDQRSLLGEVSEAFATYRVERDKVIEMAREGRFESARRSMQGETNIAYWRVRSMCEGLSDANDRDVERALAAGRRQARRVTSWMFACVALLSGLLASTAWLLFSGILRPLRRMVEEARRDDAIPREGSSDDELRELDIYLSQLRRDVAQTRNHLALSHQHLLDSEKLATIGKIAAGVAHEIRSPLTSLRLRLFSMQQHLNGADTDQAQSVRVMTEEVIRLDKIVRNFLDFSRPPDLRVQPCNLTLLIDRTLEVLRHRIEGQGLRIERREEESLPPVLADPQQLRQVLINLVNNAIEVLSVGGTIRIDASRENSSRTGPTVALRVADDGPGVVDEIRRKIFDPFTTTKSEGAGLGLWIAQRIVTQHGGELALESSSKLGTTFVARIPIVEEEGNEPNFGNR
jgi:signal transduction histidine kinase